MPQGDVPSSRSCWMPLEMLSRSLRISCRFLVPRMFLSVVWASILVLWWLSSTLATEIVAFETRKNTTASTDTVTLSLVRIWEFVGRSIYRKFWTHISLTSWGGTFILDVRMSTTSTCSMQGSSKWRPGPREPPFLRRPNRKMTARSYSVTTWREAYIHRQSL